MTGGANAGSSRCFRLDPNDLPVCGTAVSRPHRAFCLDREHAVLRRPSANGDYVMSVPVGSYGGVSVRIDADDPDPGFLIELVHDDGEFSLLLARCERPEDVADDWQAWGRALGLPLMVTMPDGTVMPYEQAEQTDLEPPPQRKRYGYLAGRRPRFLSRRKLGSHDNVIVVDFREIIART